MQVKNCKNEIKIKSVKITVFKAKRLNKIRRVWIGYIKLCVILTVCLKFICRKRVKRWLLRCFWVMRDHSSLELVITCLGGLGGFMLFCIYVGFRVIRASLGRSVRSVKFRYKCI